MSLHYLPAMIISVAILVLLLAIALKRSHNLAFIITGLGLIGACFSQCLLLNEPNSSDELFVFSPVSGLLSLLLLSILIFLWLQMYAWLEKQTGHKEEFYLLFLLTSLGALGMIVSEHFASFFLTLELMSLSFVGLIAYSQDKPVGQEAGIKYLVLSAVASAFLLMGIAIIYLQTGSLTFEHITTEVSSADSMPLLTTTGIIFILIGLFFKLSMVPCHLWVADIFQGAPLASTALLSTVSKLASFVVLWKMFNLGGWQHNQIILEIIGLVAVTSMLIGNLLALLQNNILRIMAFSSISHFGYLLILLLLFNHNADLLENAKFPLEALVFYLCAYLITLTGTFSVLMQLEGKTTLEQLSGLFWIRPLHAASLSILMLSLAGIPLTVGFMGKFYLVTATISHQILWPLPFLVIASVVGLFFYLRIIMVMLSSINQAEKRQTSTTGEQASLWFIIAVVMGLGTFPALFAEVIRHTVH
ncbi:NADH-quinone oxidoreductase subunit N [Shewanella sp. D64]|uniref:NADH-quinone oxidoreductase subunit N n=1 Tax=unclassified Shewanella TaxID=196818 RepID=UPI0022BA4541|nr:MULTISPECIES: NADH-quinone oxidoreductase subunit N [unclassified Shewanella]MEC4724767.1 NADH-quinone oxidoreductase subunit N [Shewanella sp. D64]MEC4736439.1 NADH-quinone oxidoreductase subunit N [Shewanella sp. E94]WBJ97503.1 NADH-quinone oxidoreductase subunit N [Shewanella sp. MTB7]